MRLMVYALALLAGLKVWTQDALFRNGAEDALLAVYKERAIEACRRLPQKTPGGNWTHPDTVHLVIGKPSVGVHLWQIDHPLWNARFKNPYILLSLGQGAGMLICEYDVTLGQATVEDA